MYISTAWNKMLPLATAQHNTAAVSVWHWHLPWVLWTPSFPHFPLSCFFCGFSSDSVNGLAFDSPKPSLSVCLHTLCPFPFMVNQIAIYVFSPVVCLHIVFTFPFMVKSGSHLCLHACLFPKLASINIFSCDTGWLCTGCTASPQPPLNVFLQTLFLFPTMVKQKAICVFTSVCLQNCFL